MKKALIDPTTSVQHIVGWELNEHPTKEKPWKYLSVLEQYPNSARVAEVCDTEFEVAEPFFWVDCADNVIADQFYYDTQSLSIYPVVNDPYPDVN